MRQPFIFLPEGEHGMEKRRLVYGILGFLLLIFFGMIYAWSIFIAPLEAEFGWMRSQTSLVFTFSMISFCLGNLFAGWITPRTSPRISILIAAVSICIGFAASAFTSSLLWIYVSYGVFCGFAVGVGANTVISTTLKWFADKQGTASGALLMGFGMGSMVLGSFVTMFIAKIGWRSTFMMLAALFGAVLFTSSFFLKIPPKEFSEELMAKARKKNVISARDFTSKEMLATSAFWVFMTWTVLIGSGGLALISNAVPAAKDVLSGTMDASAIVILATSAMSAISVFNGLGRFAAGFLWDTKGFRFALFSVSFVYIASMAMLICATVLKSFPILTVGFVLLGMAFGGSMSAVSAMIGSFYGTKHYGLNFGCGSCNLIAAALIGPTLIGYLKTSSGSYLSSYYVILFFGVVSLFAVTFIKKPADTSD